MGFTFSGFVFSSVFLQYLDSSTFRPTTVSKQRLHFEHIFDLLVGYGGPLRLVSHVNSFKQILSLFRVSNQPAYFFVPSSTSVPMDKLQTFLNLPEESSLSFVISCYNLDLILL